MSQEVQLKREGVLWISPYLKKLWKKREGSELFSKRNCLRLFHYGIEQAAVPRSFFSLMAEQGWFSFSFSEDRLTKHTALRESLLAEELAKISPGVAVAILAHQDLGLTGLWLFGSDHLQKSYGPSAVLGNTLLCIGNTESGAGSDSANIAMQARKVEGAGF